MLVDDETSLAWALTEAARPHLSPAERDKLHVTIAVGETFAAIHHLITSAADRRIPLTTELVQRCRSWLDAYAGHEHERLLRSLLECLLAPSTIQVHNRQHLQSVWPLRYGKYIGM
ncbi:MAG: hypothetical protein QOJ66_2910 [Ilumatobacteraceae bacterium]|jgi:hypothetical protein